VAVAVRFDQLGVTRAAAIPVTKYRAGRITRERCTVNVNQPGRPVAASGLIPRPGQFPDGRSRRVPGRARARTRDNASTPASARIARELSAIAASVGARQCGYALIGTAG